MLMEGEELSISFGEEADYLLHQNIGRHVVNSFEFIESRNSLDCRAVIYLGQLSFDCFQGWRFHSLGNPFQFFTVFMGKVISLQLGKISCCNLWLLPVVVLLHASGKSDSILPMPNQVSLSITRTLKIKGKKNSSPSICALLLFLECHPSDSCSYWELTLPPHL